MSASADFVMQILRDISDGKRHPLSKPGPFDKRARPRLNYWCVEEENHPFLRKLGIKMVWGGHVVGFDYLKPNDPYPYKHAKFPTDDDTPPDPYPVSEEFLGDANGNGVLSYHEAHPEWYGLRDGKRSSRITGDGGDNFCTSNMAAMAEWTKNAVDDLVGGRYKDAGLINA